MRIALHFISYYKRTFTLILALFLSVVMMLMGESRKTYFARSATTAIFNTGRFTFSWGIYILDLWRENKYLRLQNLDLSEQLALRDFSVMENERLRRLLDFKDRQVFSETMIPAMVIGHDFDRITNAIILKKGTKDGVRKNMAVVTADGLVGKVMNVYRSSCNVQIIMDINSKVSSVVDGIHGIIRWEGDPYLRMYGLPLATTMAAGKKVYTTGYGVYPGGILIGIVSERKFEDVEQYASVSIIPAVNFDILQEVFILRGSELSDVWEDGDGQFQRPSIQ